jgi:hypothetical protein
MLNSEIAKEMVYIYIKKSNEIRMLVHIKEISKKKNKTDFSQHSCTNVSTAVADLHVQLINSAPEDLQQQ